MKLRIAESAPSLYDRPRHVLLRERHDAANRAMREEYRGHLRAARLWLSIVTGLDAELGNDNPKRAA